MTIGLKTVAVASMVLLVWLFVVSQVLIDVGRASPATSRPPAIPEDQKLTSENLWRDVNKWRIDNGYPAYIESASACKIADVRVKEIQSDFSHDGFIPTINKLGIVGAYGENIVSRRLLSDLALRAWLQSPSHREALESNYTHSCIRTEGSHAVQIFGYY